MIKEIIVDADGKKWRICDVLVCENYHMCKTFDMELKYGVCNKCNKKWKHCRTFKDE